MKGIKKARGGMKVFIVTTGEYSDYSIHSVWSTEEQAKRMVGILNCWEDDCASMREYEVKEVTMEEVCERFGEEVKIRKG